MDWLKAIAPMVGTALGGPLGGAAAAFVADRLGLDTKTVESVSEVLNSGKMTAEQIASVKMAEIDFQKFLKQNEIDMAKMEFANTDSARQMQIAIRSKTPDVLAGIIVIGFFGILITMMLGYLQVSDQQALLILLGALSAAFGAVINFFYGSSHGSQSKDRLLAQSQPSK